MEIIERLISIFIALIFFTSLFEKVSRTKESLEHIAAYKIIPNKFVSPFFIFTMLLHLLVTIIFLSRIYLSIGTLIAISLIIIYTIAIIVNLIRKEKIDCGCLGILGDHIISWKLVFRNLIIIFLIYLSYYLQGFILNSFGILDIILFVNLFIFYSMIIISLSMKNYRRKIQK
ncbi:hypothetical protein CJ195_16490 [Bacillus sp. UMB0899]|nr:hypothetical protein CJ195_16490 [Bacillus sp. UMB0899]